MNMNNRGLSIKPDTVARSEAFSRDSIYHLLALPSISSVVVNHVSGASATLVGYLENPHNGTDLECGFAYSLLPNPTWEDNIVTSMNIGSRGQFNGYVSGLKPGTEYFIRGYVSTSNWVVYGHDIRFRTATSTSLRK